MNIANDKHKTTLLLTLEKTSCRTMAAAGQRSGEKSEPCCGVKKPASVRKTTKKGRYIPANSANRGYLSDVSGIQEKTHRRNADDQSGRIEDDLGQLHATDDEYLEGRSNARKGEACVSDGSGDSPRAELEVHKLLSGDRVVNLPP